MSFSSFYVASVATDDVELRRIRRQLVLGLAGLVVVALLLPSPVATIGYLANGPSDPSKGGSGSAGDPTTAAALTACTAVVWVILLWAGTVLLAAGAARLPGLSGRLGSRLLRALLPRSARPLVSAVVGLSLLAATAACNTATPGMDGTTGLGAGGTAPTSIATADAAPTGQPTATPGAILPGDIVAIGGLDWPVDSAALSDVEGSSQGVGPSTGAAVPTTTRSSPAPATAAGRSAVAPTTGPTTTTAATRTPAATTTPAATPATPTAASTTAISATTTPPARTPPQDTPVTGSPPTRPGPAVPTTPPGPTTPVTPAPPITPGTTQPPVASTPATPPSPRPIAGPTSPARTVVVLPGDSLWAMAARTLPPHATLAQIDATWRAWYGANRSVIGPNPNLILPGQHLRVPPPAPPTTGGSS